MGDGRAAVVRLLHRLIRSDQYDRDGDVAPPGPQEFPLTVESAEHPGWSFIIWLDGSALADDERVARFVATLASMPDVHALDRVAQNMVVVRAGRMSRDAMYAAATRAWADAAP